MEHRKTRLSLTIPLLILAFIGCKKPLEQPELSDPIYRELTEAISLTQKNIEEDTKTLNQWKADLKKPDLTVGEKRQVLKQISGNDKKIRLMAQDLRFFEIRAKSRQQHVREVYPARFEKELPWPDPEEMAEYEANKRLRGASKNWADRVPKLNYGRNQPHTGDKPAEDAKH